MADIGGEGRLGRPRLSRDRVLRGALAVADTGGLGALTIRSLAHELGVKPMSVYHHVANKEEILDGLVDIVFSEIELPSIGGDWRSQMRRRAHSARRVLRSHRWAIGLLESRPTPGPATLRHHDAVLGTLRAAGFSRELTAHAYAVIDSYTYGFALQEASLPFEATGAVAAEVADPIVEQFATDEYPHLADMVSEYYLRSGYSFSDEFDVGLGLILDALDAALQASEATRAPRDPRNPRDPLSGPPPRSAAL